MSRNGKAAKNGKLVNRIFPVDSELKSVLSEALAAPSMEQLTEDFCVYCLGLLEKGRALCKVVGSPEHRHQSVSFPATEEHSAAMYESVTDTVTIRMPLILKWRVDNGLYGTQRVEPSYEEIKKIDQELELNLIAPLSVSIRNNEIFIEDGQRRAAVLKKRINQDLNFLPNSGIMVRIYFDPTEEAAAKRVRILSTTRALTREQRAKAEAREGKVEVVQFNEFLEKLNLPKITDHKVNYKIESCPALIKLLQKDEKALEKALRLLIYVWKDCDDSVRIPLWKAPFITILFNAAINRPDMDYIRMAEVIREYELKKDLTLSATYRLLKGGSAIRPTIEYLAKALRYPCPYAYAKRYELAVNTLVPTPRKPPTQK